jgi:hypothetical protein
MPTPWPNPLPVNSKLAGTDWAVAVGVVNARVAINRAIKFLDILIR